MISMTPDGDPGALFEPLIPATDRATEVAVGRTGVFLQTQVKANASGRPGPRAPTGDYRRTIGLTVSRDAAGPFALVSTNAVQARRLEYGFIGVDALGRSYRQPPYPHWRPALILVPAVFARELDRALSASGRTA